MFHLMAVHGAMPSRDVSYETDRMRVHRPRPHASPRRRRCATAGTLSGSAGLGARSDRRDPPPDHARSASRRRRSTSSPASAETRAAPLEPGREVPGPAARRSRLRTGVDPQPGGAAADQCHRGRRAAVWRLASSVIYANPSLRADAAVLSNNRRGQSGLWGYAISGDLPIVLLQIGDRANIDLVRQLVQAHAYWRLKGLAVDLVIWNEDRAGYRQLLQDQIMGLIAAGVEAHVIDRPGGIFVRPAEQISDEDRILLQSVARAIFTDSRGNAGGTDRPSRPGGSARSAPRDRPAATAPNRGRRRVPRRDLMLFNGLGGFTRDGREYVITTAPGQVHAGAVGERAGESALRHRHLGERPGLHLERERPRIPPHALAQRPGERCQRRSVLPARRRERPFLVAHAAARAAAPVLTSTRHGFGYSVFEHAEGGIVSELTVYVALDAAVKFSVLKVRNESGRPRRLSATGYVEWVLGDLRPKSAMHVVTEIDPRQRRAVRAQPLQHRVLRPRRVLRCGRSRPARVTGDRTEFLGRNGTLERPGRDGPRAAFRQGRARRSIPARAIQVAFELADGQEREIIFRLGVGRERATRRARAGAALPRHRQPRARALEAVQQYWKHTLGAVQVETPDPVAQRAGQRLARVPDAGLPPVGAQRLLPVGRRLRLPRPAAGRRWRWCTPSPRWCASTCCAARAASSSRATCSTGGIRRRAAACARTARTTTCGCRSRPPLRAGDRRHRRAGRDGAASSKAARSTPGDDSYYDLPRRSGESATLYEHCVRAIGPRPALRRARPAADGLRRLERRHEPGRHQGQGRERVAGVLPLRRAHAVRRGRARAAATPPSPNAATRRRAQLRQQPRAARLGRRVVPPRLLRRRHAAGLGEQRRMPDRLHRAELGGAVRRGRCRRARAWPWRRWTGAWCAATTR